MLGEAFVQLWTETCEKMMVMLYLKQKYIPWITTSIDWPYCIFKIHECLTTWSLKIDAAIRPMTYQSQWNRFNVLLFLLCMSLKSLRRSPGLERYFSVPFPCVLRDCVARSYQWRFSPDTESRWINNKLWCWVKDFDTITALCSSKTCWFYTIS